MVVAEREVTDYKVRAIIKLKHKVCDTSEKSFVVINQKGIDPMSLDLLAKEGIIALRRAKRRNAERLQLSCGGYCINSIEELSPECLGYAGIVYEHALGEEKYTFVEDVRHTHSVTILVKGPTDQIISQIKDAIRDGLRSVKNVLEDRAVVRGAGSFELAASIHLMDKTRLRVQGKAKLGVDTFAHALLDVPKILADNAGFDAEEVALNLLYEHEKGKVVGVDLTTGGPANASLLGVYDNYCVKKQILLSAPIIASQLLLVDEIVRAGSSSSHYQNA